MYLTGFADEASLTLDGQIRATKELGWTHIEARNIDEVNIHDVPNDKFEKIVEKLDESGVKINCFGSTIANWGKNIEDPFDITLEEIRRAIPRMQRLGSRLVRIMSYAIIKDRGPDRQMQEERFKRLRTILQMFTDAGITPVHENCQNYGGMGAKYTLDLIENVPGLKLVFDTGNPVFTDDYSKPKPYPRQSSWEFYSRVKQHIAYVHIKDGVWDAGAGKMNYTFPGEGDGDVYRIVKDLLAGGYDGGISIEPHMSVVFHDKSVTSSDEQRHKNYVEYGRRMEKLIAKIKQEIG